jgi:excisionase family DNA binding protein
MTQESAKQLADNLATSLTPIFIKELVKNIDWTTFYKTFNPSLSLEETAALLGVSYERVSRWTNEGKLPTVRAFGKSRPRVELKTLERFCKEEDNQLA